MGLLIIYEERVQLGCHVVSRARDRSERSFVCINSFGDPKVADSHIPRRGRPCYDKDVRWLEVAMCNTHAVQFDQTAKQLLCDVSRLVLGYLGLEVV